MFLAPRGLRGGLPRRYASRNDGVRLAMKAFRHATALGLFAQVPDIASYFKLCWSLCVSLRAGRPVGSLIRFAGLKG